MPAPWRQHSDYRDERVFGWYRRKIEFQKEIKGDTVLLELGIVEGADQTFVNGILVGQTGTFPPNFNDGRNIERIYKVPAKLFEGDGPDIVAVRIFSERENSGGIIREIFPKVVSGPFDSESIGGRSTGFTVGGTGWYRKHFKIPEDRKGKRFVIQFGGVYMNADIWINGVHLGNHPYGYTSFQLDLTNHLNYGGQENILAVEVKNHGQNSRWYSGSGIYRHVDLLVTEPIHLDHWGTFVSTPDVSAKEATVKVETKVMNAGNEKRKLTIENTIINPEGEKVKTSVSVINVKGDGSTHYEDILNLKDVQLWSLEAPVIYKVHSVLKDGKTILDQSETSFGIRWFEFSAEKGFSLNGKPMLLKGGCMHHDNGPLGACAFDKAEQRRVQLMKENGYNAIRCAHNPPSPAFLDACDNIGMLVIDEAFDCWYNGKNGDDYNKYFTNWWKRDLESMICRDRNHPSIIMWSTGNEIPDREDQKAFDTAKLLAEYVRKLDPSRPVTNAVHGVNPNKDGFMEPLDVMGYNYALKWNENHKYETNCYVDDHKRIPNRVIYGAESFSLQAFDYWMAAVDYPWVVGDFVWTGFDYLGEAGIGWYGFSGNHLWTVAYCGDINLIGEKRPQSYYRDVLWSDKPEISAFVRNPEYSFNLKNGWDWTWADVWPRWNWEGHEGKQMDVEVYSNCEEVRLLLNGNEVGKHTVSRETKFIAKFKVRYETGSLKAEGYNNGEKVAEWELVTAGNPVKIRLVPEDKTIAADGQDLCFVKVEVIDSNGNLVPVANNLIEFEIEGPAKLAAVASSKPNSVESFQSGKRKVFNGKGLAIIRAGYDAGKVSLKAKSEGLQSAQIEIELKDEN